MGAFAIVIACAAAYVIISGNNPISAKPEQQQQITSPDYSSQLTSLKSQVDLINSRIGTISNDTLPALENVKTNIADMHEKLADLGNLRNNLTNIQQKLVDLVDQNNQAQQTTSITPVKVLMTLDRSSYSPGDVVHITAIRADPLKSVQIELLDSSGYVMTNKLAWADSTGSILYDLQLSPSLPFGNYQVKIISDTDTETEPITILSSVTSYMFTAYTDKGIYSAGDMIRVSGIAIPGTSVTGIMTSPSGLTYTSAANANVDGTYGMYFSTSQSYETGNWKISVTNTGQTRILSVYIQTGVSTGTYTFTAQTDKGLYLTGNAIEVFGTAIPNSSITAALTSPTKTIYNDATTANAFGSYSMTFSTSTSFETGNWDIDVSNLGQDKVLSISIESGNPFTFTANTDKVTYQSGDLIEITGMAQPSTAVSAVMTSPSGKTFTSGATANSDGAYFMFFSSGLSYESGTWVINVTNLMQTKVLTFTMQTGSSSLTAFTDKGIYSAGDVIEVTGTATPNSTVIASLTSPSGITYTSNTASNIYGSYSLSFSTSRSFETGNWHIITRNLGQTDVVSIFIQ